MAVALRRVVRCVAAVGAIASMVVPVASLATPAASDAAPPAVAASAVPQATSSAQSQAARIVSGLRIIGRVRARTSFCSALVQGGAPATAGAFGYEAALAQTIEDLRHVSLSNSLTKAHSMRPLEDDLRALADLAQAGRTELHDLGSVAERSEPNLRRAVLGYRDALDGAKARQYFLAKQIASTVGKLEEIPADSFISGADDPNILLNAVLPTVPGTNVNRLYDDLSDPDVTPATDPAFNEALAVDDRIRSDLQTAADHVAQAVLLGDC